MVNKPIEPWERRYDDSALFEHLKDQMMLDYRNAVKLLQCGAREEAQYMMGCADTGKSLLEKMFDFSPEQEIDELDGLLAILEEEL